VTPPAPLEAAWVDLPGQEPEPLPYLAPGSTQGLDIDVEVEVDGEVVSRPPYRTMYWSPAQMLAHLTVNGASTRPGDLFGSGTISGPEPGQRGSFLELCWGGSQPLPGGRTFLEDGDTVVLRYSAPGTAGGRIALGEVAGQVLPAR
jgi:fumarylacetoacetase